MAKQAKTLSALAKRLSEMKAEALSQMSDEDFAVLLAELDDKRRAARTEIAAPLDASGKRD